jgi:uncharacterized protein YndB with AHSA1/START domain
VVVFLGFVATRPASYHVERVWTIDAPAEIVFAQLEDLRAWAAWSPWEKRDPTMEKSYDGPVGQVGSSYSWQGNDEVGKGTMTITERVPNEHLGIKLEFKEPFASVAETDFYLASAGPASTRVTWAMDGNNTFMGKLFGVFMDFDSMIGADYERGLAALEAVSEAEVQKLADQARAQAEAARAAAAEADAQAQAPQRPAPAGP